MSDSKIDRVVFMALQQLANCKYAYQSIVDGAVEAITYTYRIDLTPAEMETAKTKTSVALAKVMEK